MALTKVSGGILDPGINVAGIVTATGFDGPFTGGTGSNITAGIITATGFDLNGNGDISGNLVIGGNLTANGDFTTLNTTLREVEILRVDANTTATAGIITQRGSGDILNLFDGAGNELVTVLSNGNVGIGSAIPELDLDVTRVASGDNVLKLDNRASALSLIKYPNVNNADVRAGSDYGNFAVYTGGDSGSRKLRVEHGGNVLIENGNVGIASAIPSAKLDVNGTSKFQDDVTFITATGKNIVIDKSANKMTFGDNVLAEFGDDNDLLMHHTGSTGYIKNQTGNFYIQNDGVIIIGDQTSSTTGFKFQNGGAVELYHNNLRTAFTDVDQWKVYGRTSNSGMVEIASNQGANNNDRFRIHKTSAASRLTIQNYSTGSWVENIRITAGGAVELKHADGTTKFQTGSTVNTNSAHLEITSGQQLRFDNSSNNRTSEILNDGSSGNSVLTFKTNGGNRWTIDSSGHFLPGAAATYDIGSTSAEIGNVYLADNKHIYFGNEQDLDIRFDSSNAAITLDTGTLSIINYANNEDVKILSDSGGGGVVDYIVADGSTGEVLLNHYGSQKLATSTTGISVTGEVAASQDYPLTKPVLDFNFAAEKKLDPRIKFTRVGTASFVDKKGIIRYASHNEPRFDHHPTSGVSLGLLLEQQSINYQPYSVDMSQGANNNEVTVENNAAIAPDGTMSASKITGGTNQSTSQRLGWGTQGVASSSFTMWSIWLKSEETSCIIQIYSNTYTIGADHLNIELADGTTGGHNNNDDTFRYNLEKYPNKWWRLSWGGNGNSGGNSGGMYVAVVPAMNSTRAANTGAAHSKVWYAWGLQEEVGTQTKFATSYIPTYGNAATRGADRGTIDGDDFDDFFDRYQGAVVHETSNAIQSWTYGGSGWEFNNDNYQYNVITNISSGYAHNSYPGGYIVANGENSDSGTNSSSLFGSSSATGNAPTNGGYNAGRVPNSTAVDYNRLYKTYTDGMSWDISGSTNTLIAATGGFSASGTNTNNISFRNISKFELGSDATDMDGSYQKFSGRIKRWMYYDKALTANQLVNLTAQDPVTYL